MPGGQTSPHRPRLAVSSAHGKTFIPESRVAGHVPRRWAKLPPLYIIGQVGQERETHSERDAHTHRERELAVVRVPLDRGGGAACEAEYSLPTHPSLRLLVPPLPLLLSHSICLSLSHRDSPCFLSLNLSSTYPSLPPSLLPPLGHERPGWCYPTGRCAYLPSVTRYRQSIKPPPPPPPPPLPAAVPPSASLSLSVSITLAPRWRGDT